MIEDPERQVNRWRPRRVVVAGVGVILSAVVLVACGDSSGGTSEQTAGAKTQATAAAATAEAKTTAAGTPRPTTTAAEVPEGKWEDEGMVRLAAAQVGTKGILTIDPNGNVGSTAWEHWYPVGTKVTLRVKNTPAARFVEWGGACSGKQRACTVTMDTRLRVVAGFLLNEQGAKGLAPDDPTLKPITSNDDLAG